VRYVTGWQCGLATLGGGSRSTAAARPGSEVLPTIEKKKKKRKQPADVDLPAGIHLRTTAGLLTLRALLDRAPGRTSSPSAPRTDTAAIAASGALGARGLSCVGCARPYMVSPLLTR